MPAERPAAATEDHAPDFEAALEELEALVERLEQGDLPLEEALRSFERGVALTRQCQGALSEAQQKVEILLAQGAASDKRTRDFRPDVADDDED
ncbi:MAG: exodeoxyribonuclease VII small subunit [Steroidobacteraceae bacterium]